MTPQIKKLINDVISYIINDRKKTIADSSQHWLLTTRPVKRPPFSQRISLFDSTGARRWSDRGVGCAVRRDRACLITPPITAADVSTCDRLPVAISTEVRGGASRGANFRQRNETLSRSRSPRCQVGSRVCGAGEIASLCYAKGVRLSVWKHPLRCRSVWAAVIKDDVVTSQR